MEADWEGFDLCEEIGGGNFYYELPGERNSVDDGQLKIVTDSVLAVDALDKKEDLKILVVGCSSEGGCLSGLAYEVISTMVEKSTFDMYDPYTVNVSYKIESNTFKHFQGEYRYQNVEKYDLVLDDAWQAGKRHNDIDENENVFNAKNYSVKKLPWDEERGENKYKQVFKTETHEERSVSRAVKYEYRSIEKAGDCAACVELKYLLKKDYSNSFWKMYLSSHKRNCKTGEYRIFDSGSDISMHFREVEEIPEPLKIKMRRLAWDLDMEKLVVVGDNNANLKGSIVLVSDERFLTMRVLKCCPLIIMVRKGKILVIGDLKKFGLQEKKEGENYIMSKAVEPMMQSAQFRLPKNVEKKVVEEKEEEEEDETTLQSFKGRIIGDKVTNVGIRNYVKVIADASKLEGLVYNIGREVEFIITGTKKQVNLFKETLFVINKPKCKMKNVVYTQISYVKYKGFLVRK